MACKSGIQFFLDVVYGVSWDLMGGGGEWGLRGKWKAYTPQMYLVFCPLKHYVADLHFYKYFKTK